MSRLSASYPESAENDALAVAGHFDGFYRCAPGVRGFPGVVEVKTIDFVPHSCHHPHWPVRNHMGLHKARRGFYENIKPTWWVRAFDCEIAEGQQVNDGL